MVREVPLSRARRREAGVTLLEILVAVAVLAVGLATIFQIFPMGFAASSKSASQTIAYELAAQKMEDARNDFLFGGIPNGTALQKYEYWGSTVAPNPDLTTYKRVNTAPALTPYQEFSTTSAPEKNYFYKIECDPVIDPARKYQEFPFEQGGDNRGFATMYRITVTVRGPVQTKAEAQDPVFGAGLARKAAVQVKLATYVANKTMPEARLAVQKIVRRKAGTTMTMQAGANIVLIKGAGTTDSYPYPENFTVLNRFYLTPNEILDGGPTIIDNVSRLPQNDFSNLNVLGLDNIVILRPDPDDNDDGGLSPNGFIAESNKVIAIYAPDDLGHSSPGSGFWQLTLMKDLYGRDNDFPRRASATTAIPPGYGSTKLVDDTFDSDSFLATRSVPGTPNANEDYGYPVDTQIRGLMRLERRP